MATENLWPGKPYPLGAAPDESGTNFAIFSEHAEKVELLLFDSADDEQPSRVIELTENHAYVRHGYVPGVGPGQCYAYRAFGPYRPALGLRFNEHKVLIDPYAKAIAGNVRWDDAAFGYVVGHEKQDLSKDTRDSCPFIPKSIVVSDEFNWEGDSLLNIPWNETIIYELHVKGFTMMHPDVPEHERGKFPGLASLPIIDHLRKLGVTAVELLPVHHHIDDRLLVEKGLSNYWGYNTIGYFAPDCRFSTRGNHGGQVAEFKQMVKHLHRAGIEVILDVVYNHTAEGSHLGPTLSFRGIDNSSYYHLMPETPRYYMDFTGTGNTLNTSHPNVTQMIMDSLRYWVVHMHVDGFRFDLASALARELFEVDRLASFFDIIHQDPILSQVKLIAEPWDVGPGGYQVGKFPPLWTEWNGRYRDAVRRYWRGDGGTLGELAYRLAGSSDLYEGSGRLPTASINFVTCHDGFTLNDLVSYESKHNEANKMDNEDGTEQNISWNCGAEGPTDDPAVSALRARQRRNFLATLLLSQGVPMITAGDEIANSQSGNNNAFCQDNAISWIDWKLDDTRRRLLDFARMLVRIRREHPVFRRKKFFQGKRRTETNEEDISWLRPDGTEMTSHDWHGSSFRAIAVLLSGDSIAESDEHGRRIIDDDFLLMLNGSHESVIFRLPENQTPWRQVFYTAQEQPMQPPPEAAAREEFALESRSLALFCRRCSANHGETP